MLSLAELLAAAAPGKATGRPQALTEEEKDRLVATTKRDFETRRMSLVDLQCEAGLGHVCPQTILTALNERGLKCYREQYKFILKPEGRAQRLAYCQARKDWLPDKEWANIAFTDEMSIEIGGSFGVSQVWRGNDEKWDQTCVGATKKRCPTMMCWGMIGWNYKVITTDILYQFQG